MSIVLFKIIIKVIILLDQIQNITSRSYWIFVLYN
nr:MAG TPA: hypothetical protein [Caudoviricetes sp.]